MITHIEIRQRISEAIRQSGKTQNEIAEALKVRQQTVQQYVAMKVLPSLDTFANLCIILDLDANEILGNK